MTTQKLRFDDFDNNFSKSLSSAVNNSDLTIYLSGVPAKATEGYLVLDSDDLSKYEIIYFNTVGSNYVSCPAVGGRGQGGTSARAHDAGAPVKMYLLGEHVKALRDAIFTGFFELNYVPVYASASTITIPTDVSAIFTAGRKLKITFASSGVKYFAIKSSSYAAGNTTVALVFETVLNEAISKIEMDVNPQAFSQDLMPETPYPVYAHGMARQAIINPGGQDISRVVVQRGAVVSGVCNNWANHLLYYGADRWLAYTSDANGIQQASFAGGYFGVYKANNAATNKLSQIQIIEAANSYGLRGKKLSFGFIADKAGTTAKDITVFILAMKAAGTADSVTNAPISAFGADGVRPTFNTTNYDVLYEGDFTAAQMDGATRLIGTTSIPVPSDAKNIIFGVVNKQNNTAGDSYGGFKIKEVLLCSGDVALPFQPKSYEEELRACLRYYQSFSAVVETITISQSLTRPVALRIVVAATGGGAGYTEGNVSVYALAPFQTTRGAHTLTWNAEL